MSALGVEWVREFKRELLDGFPRSSLANTARLCLSFQLIELLSDKLVEDVHFVEVCANGRSLHQARRVLREMGENTSIESI